MKRVLLDANVVLRFLLNEDPVQSPQAAALFEDAAAGRHRLLFTEGVLLEVIWVLQSHYEKEIREIVPAVTQMLASAGVVTETPGLFEAALSRLARTEHDPVDCLLAARAPAGGLVVASFDKHLQGDASLRVWPGIAL